MNILFLCTANLQRSRTAEDLFRPQFKQHVFRSAGLSEKECTRNGSALCTEALLKWADTIYVFEPMHLERIRQHTGELYMKKIQCLHIEDIYQYMQPKLISELKPLSQHFKSRRSYYA
ncbi:hypothetical protein KDX31_17445 [Amphritea atlantica]|uniref:Protein-tyrosine-phosphatase n=1 Tax=Amphritea atlantica TaxID=355243 RepID=A0ABY5GSX7_9GAMM|nr:hypothetical protein KDX31_17445 [Amphritea atlantica]